MITLTHEDLDQRLIRMHEVVAGRLRSDPSLLLVAKETLSRWRGMGITPGALEEWEKLMDGPREDLLAMMVADTQEMRRLRQSSPFCGTQFIDNRTRWKLINDSRGV